VVRELDHNPVEHAPRGKAQNSISRAFHQLDKAGVKTPVYLIVFSPAHASAIDLA
jgi:hypothetical protein